MKGRHVICIVVDGLRASALGAYGNTSHPTPQLDALASRSLVTEWLMADSPSLEGFYRSAWQGVHALQTAEPIALPQRLHEAGVLQWLATDDPWLTEQATHLPFDEALLVETQADEPADAIEETVIAQLFSHTLEQLADWREDVAGHVSEKREAGSLLWLHTRGLFGPWDAPPSMREEQLDEGDPSPAEYVSPPGEIRQVDDPDMLLTHRVAYAAQVGVVDACVGAFLQAIEQAFGDSETLVMVLGSRGFALGEHGSIGTDCDELFGERLHLPWLLHECGNRVPLLRSSGLAQPADVGATVLDWLGIKSGEPVSEGISLMPSLRGEISAGRKLAVSAGVDGELTLRTSDWMLRCPAGSPSSQLYAKPDDRWEFNDVATRCREEVRELEEVLKEFRKRC